MNGLDNSSSHAADRPDNPRLTWWRVAWLASRVLWVAGVVMGYVAGLWVGAAIIGGGTVLGEIARRHDRFMGGYARRVASAIRPLSKRPTEGDAANAGLQRSVASLSRITPPPALAGLHSKLVSAARLPRVTGTSPVEDTQRQLQRRDELAGILESISTQVHDQADHGYYAHVTSHLGQIDALRDGTWTEDLARFANVLDRLRIIEPPPDQVTTHEALIDAVSKLAHMRAEQKKSVDTGPAEVALHAAGVVSAQRDLVEHILKEISRSEKPKTARLTDSPQT